MKPGVYPGLILSGAMYPDLKIGVSRRERMIKMDLFHFVWVGEAVRYWANGEAARV